MESQQSTITRHKVFVPGSFPQYSYVSRKFLDPRTKEPFNPEDEIAEAIKQDGMIAQVVGPSKSGKTRAVENCVGFRRLVLVAGSQITETVSLWDIVLRLLQESHESERERSEGTMYGAEAKGAGGLNIVGLAKAEVELTGKHERTAESTATERFTVDAFHAATSALVKQDKVLFIDDFHTIPVNLQPLVAAQLKAASGLNVTMCLAEVPHHSDSTISALPDLTARVIKIQFQYWSDEDLLQIGVNGFDELNIDLSPASLQALALEASGSPQLMQLICLNTAKFLKIEHKLSKITQYQLDVSQIRTIMISTHGTVDRDRIFSLLDRGPELRGKKRKKYPIISLGKGDNYEIALAAISLSPPVASLSWTGSGDNLNNRIDKICHQPTNRPAKEQIVRALEQMQALAEEHMPRQPIVEWSASTGLHILDPYFLYYLRWSAKYEPIRSSIPPTSALAQSQMPNI